MNRTPKSRSRKTVALTAAQREAAAIREYEASQAVAEIVPVDLEALIEDAPPEIAAELAEIEAEMAAEEAAAEAAKPRRRRRPAGAYELTDAVCEFAKRDLASQLAGGPSLVEEHGEAVVTDPAGQTREEKKAEEAAKKAAKKAQAKAERKPRAPKTEAARLADAIRKAQASGNPLAAPGAKSATVKAVKTGLYISVDGRFIFKVQPDGRQWSVEAVEAVEGETVTTVDEGTYRNATTALQAAVDLAVSADVIAALDSMSV